MEELWSIGSRWPIKSNCPSLPRRPPALSPSPPGRRPGPIDAKGDAVRLPCTSYRSSIWGFQHLSPAFAARARESRRLPAGTFPPDPSAPSGGVRKTPVGGGWGVKVGTGFRGPGNPVGKVERLLTPQPGNLGVLQGPDGLPPHRSQLGFRRGESGSPEVGGPALPGCTKRAGRGPPGPSAAVLDSPPGVFNTFRVFDTLRGPARRPGGHRGEGRDSPRQRGPIGKRLPYPGRGRAAPCPPTAGPRTDEIPTKCLVERTISLWTIPLFLP